MVDALNVYISQKAEGMDRLLMRVAAGVITWEPVELHVMAEPTVVLPGDAARALLDALMRHYQGASDMHTVRADLLHERKRVDKLTDAVIAIAAGGPK
jgi:hypothetical protein